MNRIDDLTQERSPSAHFEPGSSRFIGQLRWSSIIICFTVIGFSCSVVLSWLFDRLNVIPDRIAMVPSVAWCLLLGGISLLLYHQQQRKSNWIISAALYLLPSLAIVFCLINLINYVEASSLVGSLADSNSVVKLRMPLNTAIGLLCFNAAVLLLVTRYYLTAQLLIILVAAISLMGLLGHIYDIALFYSIDSVTKIAIPTAICLLLLALAFLGACSTKGWMRVITREEAGGVMARWLLPLVVIIPPLLGSIFWSLFRGNVYYLELIVALGIIPEMLIFGVIVWWTAQKLNRSDRQKQDYYQQLLETKTRFQAIFDQTFQFTGLLKPDGTLLEANQTALDFGGITKSDVVDRPFWEAHWWKISLQTQERLRQAIAIARTGQFVRYPVEVQGKDNQVITIDFSLRPVKDQTGKIVLIIPEGRDISDRIKTEQALQESQAKYQAIVEEQTELICRHRQDATVSYVNDAFCRYFGIEKEQIIDRQYTPVVYEADRQQVEELVGSMNWNNPTVTIENRVIAKGEIRWTQWNNRMIFDGAANFIEYQSVGRDITSLKEIELKLKESEEKFRLAFEDAATGEALVAPEGTFIQVNRSLCEIVGYGEAQLLAKTFQEITHPDDLDLDLSYIRQLLAGEIRTYQMEKRYFHRLGYIVWVLINVSLVRDIDNRPKYFVAQIQNVTQRKRTEARLQDLVKELERSNQELDEFASVVSHDLISPLHKQLMLFDLLQEEYGAVLESSGNDYLLKATRLNFRMESLTRSLLAYARITTQAQPFMTVALNEVVNNAIYELEPEIAQIEAQIKVAELPVIQGDRLQLSQLFLNLLQNALKFHCQDCTPRIEISYQSDHKHHKITVSDNGIGFEPEQQFKIFTLFHRLHSQSKYLGTGLGLAICQKIVDRHQGTITAQSQPNCGATFTVCLPKDTSNQSLVTL